jgi:glycosyltransferase involved in cell wall biosynthesis
MAPHVAAFTDTYLPTLNGVTYTVRTWREHWAKRGGRMDVAYPGSGHEPEAGEYPVRSLPFPFYDGFRLGAPTVPAGVGGADLVHSHTPFTVGLAGYRFARRRNLPFVASYHTPTAEYANYVVPDAVSEPVARASERWERTFFGLTDAVVVPSAVTADEVRERVGADTRVEVVPNGVDTERFRPVDTDGFRERHGLPEGPLVGYTGRHGYEKRLDVLVEAAADLDATVVFGGDGPARADLESAAAESGADVRFLGLLDRAELPAFYSALDAFAFPSPVETQGLVALEAICCGTPVVGADAGALADTIDAGETGYRFAPGDAAALVGAVGRTLAERERLGENCLERREEFGVEAALDRLERVYAAVR